MAQSRAVRVIDTTINAPLATRAAMADNIWTRFVGLMGRPNLAEGEGLVITPCNSVHMFFMQFPLDILHLDRDGVVLRVVDSLKPWRVGPIVGRGHHVVELPAGTLKAAGVIEGHRVQFEPIT